MLFRSIPSWLAARWRAAYGEATLAALAATVTEEPATDLTPRDPDEAEALAPALQEQARAAGLATSEYAALRTMLGSGEALQLAELKAVAAGYPLRGSLQTRRSEQGQDEATRDIPAPGEAWVEPRLLPLMGMKLGDSMQVGASRLKVTRLIVLEPDRAGEFFAIAQIGRAHV